MTNKKSDPAKTDKSPQASTWWQSCQPALRTAGLMSAPTGAAIAGHLTLTAALAAPSLILYVIAALSALFGSSEISRRAFQLLGFTEPPQQPPPRARHSLSAAEQRGGIALVYRAGGTFIGVPGMDL